jgi:hypothetical protein
MWNVKKIEKAIQIETEGLREKILKTRCPHRYGMKDTATKSSDLICNMDCEKCWDGEVEDDKT